MASSPESETKRAYGQLCAVALGLDEVGERWTLLILRDLARAPLRFTDLQAINPGISPTVLTKRLRLLEHTGLIERPDLRAPGSATKYQLADSARPHIVSLLSAVAELGAFMLEQNPPEEDQTEPLATQMQLNGNFVLARGSSLRGYFVLDMMGWLTHVTLDDSFAASADAPPDREPDATATFFPPTTLMRIMGRTQTMDEAEAAGLMTISGNRDAMIELIGLLSFA